MTCIVGLEYEDGVIIGCDAAAVTGSLKMITTTPKVFRLQNLLIGYTWSFRMGQVLQYAKDIPDLTNTNSNYEYLVSDFVPFVRSLFKDAGIMKVENSVEEGGQFLVGIRGQLFEINSDFCVLRYEDGFNAVGSGQSYALGALYSRSGRFLSTPNLEWKKKLVEIGLETAEHFCTTVSSPFKIMVLENK